MTIGEGVLHGESRIGHSSHIQTVFLLVILQVQQTSIRHLEYRHLSLRHTCKLFGYHVPCHSLHVLTGASDAIACDMVTHFLLRMFHEHLIRTSDTPVIDYRKVLVFDEQVIAPVLIRLSVGLLLVHAIFVVVLFGKRQQSFIVAFLLQLIQFRCVIARLQIGNGGIKNLLSSRALRVSVESFCALYRLRCLFLFLNLHGNLVNTLREHR